MTPGLKHLLTALLFSATQAAPSFQNRLDAKMAELVGDGEPGSAVCVVADGKVIYSGARGLANLRRAEPMTPGTPVYIASLAKAFTTVAILQLVEQDKFSLDERVVDLLPGLPQFMAPVTVRHLLTHTSGLPAPPLPLEDRPNVTNADVMSFLRAQTALKFPAGSQWSYSNEGFVLLAELFGKLTGKPIADHFADQFFAPLGMTSTFVYSPATRDRERATGYRKENAAWVEDDYAAYTVGPGGVYSSAADMCRWGIAIDAGKLLKRMTLIAAFSPHVDSGASPTPMGLGFQVEDIVGGPLAGEWYVAMFGSRDGFRGVDMKLKSRPFRYIQVSNSSRMFEPMALPNLYFDQGPGRAGARAAAPSTAYNAAHDLSPPHAHWPSDRRHADAARGPGPAGRDTRPVHR